MKRVCFQLQVKPDRIAEYRARHEEVWPEMLEALEATGWRNYSLFLSDTGMRDRLRRVRRFRSSQASDGGDRRERTLAGGDGRVLRGSRGTASRRGAARSWTRSSTLTEHGRAGPSRILVLEHADKSFGAVHALEDAHIELLRRRGARARGRERRRQVDARQDPRRRPPPRPRPAAARRRGGDLRQRQAVAGGGDRDHLPGADALPRPQRRREHLHRRAAAEAGPPDRPAQDAPRRASRCSSSSASASIPTASRAGSRSPISSSSRSRRRCTANARVIVMDEPTAALTTTRGRAAVRDRRDAARARRGRALHLAPARGGVRALPARDRDARRPARADPADRGADDRVDHPRDGRPRHGARSSRRSPTEPGRVVLEGRAADARGRLHRRLVRRARAARSSRSPASSAPAAARWRARSSASTAGTRARSRSTAGRSRPARRPARWPRASGSSPRTAGSRGSSWTSRSSATSRSPRSAACSASA